MTAVYIHPRANGDNAIKDLSSIVLKYENTYPDSLLIVGGDFNQTNLRRQLPSYHQQVTSATRGTRVLDHLYCKIKGAYKSVARPHLGNSDHEMILLIPAYKQLLKTIKPEKRTILKWTDESADMLKNCFETTDWNIFRSDPLDIDDYADTVAGYIKFCEELCLQPKEIVKYPNSKPWFDCQLWLKVKEKDRAYKQRVKNPIGYKEAKIELAKCIKAAKLRYKDRIEENLSSKNSREVWAGIQTITNYKKSSPQLEDSDPLLKDKLNLFYARFDRENNENIPCKLTVPTNETCLALTPADVIKTLSRLNTRKAAGPDRITPRLLRTCAWELADVLTDISNRSLYLGIVPKCFKESTIIPVPKSKSVSTLNDYRPVALTSHIMKCLERLVISYVKPKLDKDLDRYQFAYKSNRSVEDAINYCLHFVLRHLEPDQQRKYHNSNYARVLFVDYSSAFNTIVPGKLYRKLIDLSLPISICNWLLDFLLYREQVVRIGNCVSESLVLNTGTPQGCCLSPMLFSIFTYDCTQTHSSNLIIKFADDTTVSGLISNDDESLYREEVSKLVEWCDTNNLCLNVEKTKEIVIDFRTTRSSVDPLMINGRPVEIVHGFKYLGIQMNDNIR
jgi:hypothetical protein